MLIINYLLIAIMGILFLTKRTKWAYILFLLVLLLTFAWFLHHASDSLRLNL